MGDWGMRIADAGKDAKTCTDMECVLTSKYPVLKGGIEGIVTGSDSSPVDDTYEFEITINHNLGFIPVVRIFLETESGEYIEIPETEWGAGVFIYDTYYEHTSVNQIKIYAMLWVDGGLGGDTFSGTYHYYISNEKVNI